MKTPILFAVALGLLAVPAWPEVVDSAAGGFTVRTTLNIKAAPADVYTSLISGVGKWWDSAHTFSHDARNLSIDAKPMGCFCEKLPGGGGVRHMEVVYTDPGKGLVLTGGLGPLLSHAVAGSMEIHMTAAAEGTKLVVTYAVTGYLPAGMSSWAAPVDSVLNQQFNRLKNYIERGDPASKPAN
jgi:hypothetical protein